VLKSHDQLPTANAQHPAGIDLLLEVWEECGENPQRGFEPACQTGGDVEQSMEQKPHRTASEIDIVSGIRTIVTNMGSPSSSDTKSVLVTV
jgi:hypothetical protein